MAQSDPELAGHPGPHPDPPDDLHVLPLPIRTLRSPWFRRHRADRDAIYFGRSISNRFSDPLNHYGVLYLGVDPECAFIETFGQETGRVIIRTAHFQQRTISVISASRAVSLVDITGAGLVHVGADARLFSGDHQISQRWSRAFLTHPDSPDGILYRARHDPSRQAIALFERTDLEVWSTPLGFDLLDRILTTYQIEIIP